MWEEVSWARKRQAQAVEEGGYAWDVPPGLGGEEGEVIQGSEAGP